MVFPVPKATSSNSSSISDLTSEVVYGLTTVEEAKSFILGIMHLLIIVGGSALRLPMFDEYGFTAQYPLSLFGEPPMKG